MSKCWQVRVWDPSDVDGRPPAMYHFIYRIDVEKSIRQTWSQGREAIRFENMADGSIVVTDPRTGSVLVEGIEINVDLLTHSVHF